MYRAIRGANLYIAAVTPQQRANTTRTVRITHNGVGSPKGCNAMMMGPRNM